MENKLSSILFSVIIPVHNRTVELRRAVNSVINQSIKDIEILIVDDASEEDIGQVVESFNDNRIRFFKLESKGNANVARNKGIQESQGAYIAMLDSDDAWKENHLSSRLAILTEDASVDGVFGSFLINNNEPRIARALIGQENMVDYLLNSNPSGTPTLVMKSDCAKDILFDPKIERHQDYDFLIRFSDKYNLVHSDLCTVIVYWNKIENIKTNFNHCMGFIDKFKDRIKPKTYHAYHKDMYSKAKLQNADPNTVSHYYKEAVKYKKHISLVEYLEWVKPKNVFNKIYHRMVFIAANMK